MQRLFMTDHGDPVSAVTVAEARQILARIAEGESPGAEEMVESAARSVVAQTFEMLGRATGVGPVLIVAGKGYTGAVGIALGRHLSNHGVEVTLHTTEGGDWPAWDRQLRGFCRGSGIHRCGVARLDETLATDRTPYKLIVDAILGGSVRSSDNEIVPYIDGICSYRKEREETSRSRVLSLEMPSGIDGTTGVPEDPFIAADMTISFGFPRTGMSAPQCGSIAVADVGIPPTEFHREAAITYPCVFRGEFVLRLRTFT